MLRFDGSKSWVEVIKELPSNMSDLMHDDFIANFFSYKETMLRKAIEENTQLDWTPKSPLHFFHGDCDDIVDCMHATRALEAFIANGSKDVQLTIIPGGNHATTGLYAIRGALKWFNT